METTLPPSDNVFVKMQQDTAQTRPRTLLFYTHAMAGGGAERVWAMLASGFAQRGMRVLLAVDYTASENMAFVHPAVELVVLGGGHLLSTLRLARLLRREKPDVTLSAISSNNLKHLAASFFAGRTSQAVQTYHGYAESEPQRLSRLSYILTPLSSRIFARSIAVSDGLLTYMRKVWFADKARTLRLYNPVPMSTMPAPQTRDALLAREPLVISAGRFVDYKNFIQLIDAFAKVTTPGARLVILGKGPEEPILRARIAQNQLEERVTLAGYVADPWALYDQARCFALTSRSESFGLVVAEALSRGLAVVTTQTDGPAELLEHGRHGTLVPIGDIDATARAIDAALRDPGDPLPRIRRANEFTIDHALRAYDALFSELRRPGKPPKSVKPTSS